MAEAYALFVEGLESLEDIENLDADILKNARNAVNKTADRTRTSAQRQMLQEVAFKAQYVQGRLTVSRKASGTNIEAVISGRDRPTSLARFVTNPRAKRGQRLGLMVEPGKPVELDKGQVTPRAFLIQLRGGNQGLAIRLKPGESLTKSRRAKKLADNLYLLYGPSIDQVFQGVAKDQSEQALAFLESEFQRLMAVSK